MKNMLIRKSRMRRIITVSFALVVVVVVSVLFVSTVRAQTEQATMQTADPGNLKWALVAAAMSTGFGCLGAGIAVAYVGAAAVGAVAEKPQIAGRTLIFVGLAEGIAIYGLIIAIMILGKV